MVFFNFLEDVKYFSKTNKNAQKKLHIWRNCITCKCLSRGINNFKKGMRKIKKRKNLINLLKGKICVLLLSISCISIFFNNLTLAASVTANYSPWHDRQANRNGWFVEQGGTSWCRITCSKIVLWDILQKAVNGGGVNNVNVGKLTSFFFPVGVAPTIQANVAPAPPVAAGAANFDEELMKFVFTNNRGLIDRKHFFKVTPANQLLFKNQIDAYLTAIRKVSMKFKNVSKNVFSKRKIFHPISLQVSLCSCDVVEQLCQK